MRDHRFIGALAAVLFVFCLVGIAKAQTVPPAGTRVTPCDAVTPNDAVCITWAAPATMADGMPTVLPLTYRVQQSMTDQTHFADIGTALTASSLYVKKLAPGTYYFRVYANCTPNCTESGASNIANKATTSAIVQPNPPALQVVQVVIGVGVAPIYRAVTPTHLGSTLFGFVPVGRECGKFVAKWRNRNWYLVTVQPSELWYTTDATNLAAPCA